MGAATILLLLGSYAIPQRPRKYKPCILTALVFMMVSSLSTGHHLGYTGKRV